MSCINSLLRETKTKCLSDGMQFSKYTHIYIFFFTFFHLRENNSVFFSAGKIEIYGQQIIPLYDPPHLLKGIRNNLLTKNIEVVFENLVNREHKNKESYEKVKKFRITPDFIEEINEKTKLVENTKEDKFINSKEANQENKYLASWDILELAYNIDNKAIHTIKKQMPKLNDGHIVKKKIRKMRVNLAAQVLSTTMVAFIRLLTCIKGLHTFYIRFFGKKNISR